MSIVDEDIRAKESKRSCITCSVFFIIFAVLSALLLYGFVQFGRIQSRIHKEERDAKRRQRIFEDVKSGESSALILVNSKVLRLLASDSDCIANLAELNFSMAEISPEDAKHVSRLSNLKLITFYDTSGADHILREARGLPIEQLSFQMTKVSEEQLSSLADFKELRRINYNNQTMRLTPEESEILRSLPDTIEVE